MSETTLTRRHQVAMFCDPTSSRHPLGNVHFAADRLEATDGRVLVTVPCQSNGMDGKLVDGKEYAKAMRESKYDMTVESHDSGEYALLSWNQRRVTHRIPFCEGRFPRTNDMIESAKHAVSKGAVTLCIASDVLSKIAEYAKLQATPDMKPKVTFYVTPDPAATVLFYVHDSESVCVAEGVLMQVVCDKKAVDAE